jgi:hypothetical protein
MASLEHDMVVSRLDQPVEEEAKELNVTIGVLKRHRFAAYLTEGLGIPEAGVKVGVGVAQAYRYANDPVVEALVDRWRNQIANRAIRRMTRHADEAVDVVVEVMNNPKVSPQTRIQAAFGLLKNLGADVESLRDKGNTQTRVVIEKLISLNLSGAAQEQVQRAHGEGVDISIEDALDGDFEDVE